MTIERDRRVTVEQTGVRTFTVFAPRAIALRCAPHTALYKSQSSRYKMVMSAKEMATFFRKFDELSREEGK